VAFGLRRQRVPAKEVERRVIEALELVSLAGYQKRRRAQLSGGQQQRVALARALVNRPQVLLLDEPLGALDLKLRKQMQLELKRIQREVGITFVFVTHDQEEAMTISDRIAVMNKGRIEQLGAPEEVYERPATEFVAEFLGASNLLDGVYRGSQDDLGLVELDSGARIRIPYDPQLVDGERLRVGVRPEKIHVIPAGAAPTATQNVVAGTLRSAVFAGVSFQYFFQTQEGREMSAFDRNASGGAVARPGEAVRLAWAPEHTFVIPLNLPAAEQQVQVRGEE
jgi:spermidine/putrescine transport system ATP-binding protein